MSNATKGRAQDQGGAIRCGIAQSRITQRIEYRSLQVLLRPIRNAPHRGNQVGCLSDLGIVVGLVLETVARNEAGPAFEHGRKHRAAVGTE